jgi:hypothetical protein
MCNRLRVAPSDAVIATHCVRATTDVAPELRQRQQVIEKIFACSDLPDVIPTNNVARLPFSSDECSIG